MLPVLRSRVEDGVEMPLLLWRFDRPLQAISSGPLGGGIGRREWLVNATVPLSYRRDDPDAHLGELAGALDLPAGRGLGFLTGVDVRRHHVARDSDVLVVATVGIAPAEWAAAPPPTAAAAAVGTINIFVYLPVPLMDAALVNAVATATEAKSQAMWELGYSGTGTATDAVAVLCPPAEAGDADVQSYGGPRSRWGARLARAVHLAVIEGGRRPPGT